MIKKAKKEDIYEILEIENLIIGHKNRKSMLLKFIESDQCFIAKENDEITGYLLFDKNFFENNFIVLLMVDPKKHNQGIGSSLIKKYEEIIKEGKLFTSTNRSNCKMINLLYKLRFSDSGIVYNLDENDPEMIFYKEILTDHKLQDNNSNETDNPTVTVSAFA